MSNVRDDRPEKPDPKIPQPYHKPTAQRVDPDELALAAAREIDSFYVSQVNEPEVLARRPQRLAAIQVVVRRAMDEFVMDPPSVLFPAKENPSDLGLVTEVELAAALKVTTQALAVWRAADEGPVWTKLGRSIYYKRADIDDWINGNRSAS